MYNPFSLENKVIIVTGASSGIGAQCAIDCSKMGAKVVLIGRNEERLRQTLDLCDEPHRHLVISYDLVDAEGMSAMVKDIVNKVGKISGLVNCAGISTTLPINLVKKDTLDQFFETNVYSAYFLTKECAKKSVIADNGLSVVFLSSVMGHVGENGKSIYSMTKGALVAGMKSLACELGKKNVRLNCISPGCIITPINENLPHIADPEKRAALEGQHLLGLGQVTDISNACIYLLSDAARWVTGTNLMVDGGYTAK